MDQRVVWGFLSFIAFAATALAAPPENADPTLAPWFQSLKVPGTHESCCSIADCRITDYKQSKDGYEVLIDARFDLFPEQKPGWMAVPPERVLEQTDNPTGRAVVCYVPSRGILCFVRPAET